MLRIAEKVGYCISLLNLIKMRKMFLLFMTIFMFVITTSLLVMIPLAVQLPMDMSQRGFLFFVGAMGYFGTYLYYCAYKHRKVS